MTGAASSMGSFQLESVASCGRFWSGSRWLDLKVRPVDEDGMPIRIVDQYSVPRENLRSFMNDVVFTLKNTGKYLQDTELQTLLTSPCQFEISALGGRVEVIDKYTAKRWDVSDETLLRHDPSHPSKCIIPRKYGGLQYQTLKDLIPELLGSFQEAPAITSGPAQKPSVLSLPSLGISGQLDTQNISLLLVRDWCLKKPLAQSSLRDFESFKARLRQDFLVFAQNYQQAAAQKQLTPFLEPLQAKKANLEEQIRKDPAKQPLLGPKVAALTQFLANPETEDTLMEAFEEGEVHALVQRHLEGHPRDKPLCEELLANDLLKNQLHARWKTEILPQEESGWGRWKKYLTIQNIAAVSLTAGASLLFSPITAVAAVGAGYLAYRNIEGINQSLLSSSTTQHPSLLHRIRPNIRKTAIIAAAGLATAGLTWIFAPTTVALSLAIAAFAPKHLNKLDPVLQTIPWIEDHPTFIKVALASLAAAYCSGMAPVVWSAAVLGGILGGVLARNSREPQTVNVLKSLLGESIVNTLLQDKIKWLALPLIGALVPYAIGHLIPQAAGTLIPFAANMLLPSSFLQIVTMIATNLCTPFLQQKLLARFANRTPEERMVVSALLFLALNFLSPRIVSRMTTLAQAGTTFGLKKLASLMIPSGWAGKAAMAYFMLMGKHIIKHGSASLHRSGWRVPILSEKASYLITAAIWGLLFNCSPVSLEIPATIAWNFMTKTNLAKIAAGSLLYTIIRNSKVSKTGKIITVLLGASAILCTFTNLATPLTALGSAAKNLGRWLPDPALHEMFSSALFGNLPTIIFSSLSSLGLSNLLNQRLSGRNRAITTTALLSLLNFIAFWQLSANAGRFYWKAAALSLSHTLSGLLQTRKNQRTAPPLCSALFWTSQCINFYLPYFLGIFPKATQ